MKESSAGQVERDLAPPQCDAAGTSQTGVENAEDTTERLLAEAEGALRNLIVGNIEANDPVIIDLLTRIPTLWLKLQGIESYCQQICGGGNCGSGPVCLNGIDPTTEMPGIDVDLMRWESRQQSDLQADMETSQNTMQVEGRTLTAERRKYADDVFDSFVFDDAVSDDLEPGEWEYTSLGHEWTRSVVLRQVNGESETHSLVFAVRFEPNTALIMEAFSVDKRGRYWGSQSSKSISLYYNQMLATLDAHDHERATYWLKQVHN